MLLLHHREPQTYNSHRILCLHICARNRVNDMQNGAVWAYMMRYIVYGERARGLGKVMQILAIIRMPNHVNIYVCAYDPILSQQFRIIACGHSRAKLWEIFQTFWGWSLVVFSTRAYLDRAVYHMPQAYSTQPSRRSSANVRSKPETICRFQNSRRNLHSSNFSTLAPCVCAPLRKFHSIIKVVAPPADSITGNWCVIASARTQMHTCVWCGTKCGISIDAYFKHIVNI